jgi:DNA-binding FadR family transcriptional regulator
MTDTVSRTLVAGGGATAQLLLEMIEELGLQPGDRLPVERDLAVRLDVSRSTVREAIRTLSSMGVLAARQGSGTYVTDLSTARLAAPLQIAVERNATSASQLMDVRGMLEVGATELAATRATAADVKRLRKLAAAITREHGGARNLAADRAFHSAIHELSGNELLVALINPIWELAANTRERIMEGEDVLDRTLAAHERIIAALETGDPDLAGAAMRAHIEDIRRWLQRAIAAREALANGQSNP